jgi:hypothetical protein
MAEDPVLARKVAVLSMEYAVRTVRALAQVWGATNAERSSRRRSWPPIRASTFSPEDDRVLDPDDLLADERRRPVSVS